MYQHLKNGTTPEGGFDNFYRNISFKLDQTKLTSFNCYFVHLQRPIEVEATTKKFF